MGKLRCSRLVSVEPLSKRRSRQLAKVAKLLAFWLALWFDRI